jgi:hypothetical protein
MTISRVMQQSGSGDRPELNSWPYKEIFGGRLGDDMPKRIYFSLENTGLQGGYWVKLHARVLCF